MDKASQFHFHPHCSACHNFLKGGHEEVRTMWLAPHKVETRNDAVHIMWACNLGKSCENAMCIYSVHSRDGR